MDNEELYNWIPTSEAQELTGYTGDHLRRLCNAGKVDARKIGKGGAGGHGGMWLINRDDLLEYQRTTKPGKQARPDRVREGGGET